MTFAAVTADLFLGFFENIKLFGVTLIFAIPLGLLIAFGSMTRFAPLRMLTRAFVWVIRGTPLMLQLFVVFYVPGLVFDAHFPGENPRMTAAAVAFVINYACYFSEIYRGGIQGVPVGQQEAGQVLGLTKSQVFFKVTLLQMVKRIVPPMSNEIITLVKDTALAQILGVVDLLNATTHAVNTYVLLYPFIIAAVFYLLHLVKRNV